MAIKVGDKIPSMTLKRLGENGMEDVDTGKLFAGKKVVMFGVPGAFTPTCSGQHLPGYVSRADDLKSKGVDEIVCLSVNDPFVMKSWAEQQNVGSKVTMLADGNCEFTKELGVEMDGRGAGLGTRCKRFMLIADDGKVTDLSFEEKSGSVEMSGADACAARLG